ncbi:glycine betaine ABC transporter substrate-binding protein [uncultured Thiohalocapsa sp.]|uniref:glycine betaine ABC transporter substrate-binding protein n=1 Tax=uncultured Thiohalocapsa sp. TaxID=768990 RepID=UPI0025DCEF4F|nr:glycine betaine ABC transporter substrate-binding protein [uncultured Thiohalocapsa sp.]
MSALGNGRIGILLKTPALLALLTLALLLGGCGEHLKPVRIGSQDFTEQKLLAEMMALLAEDAGVRVERAIPYGDNRKSLQAIQRGVLDAYPEYDGSLLSLSGVPRIRDPRTATTAVRELVTPLGLRWLEPFGVEDGFAVAIRRDLALRDDVTTISDLAALPGAISFAADEGYLARPVDGLYALARRYGLRLGQVALFPVGDRNAIYNALAEQQVNAAEVFMTDARLDDYGIVALEDDLGFYSIYRPAPLVREAILQRHPQLEAAWNKLAGRISSDDMRSLNARVERNGEDYRDVAKRHLEELGLLPEAPVAREPRGTVTLAVSPLSDMGYLPIRAAEAIHEVMPARRLQVTEQPVPADAVRDGSARFGLLGAEELFDIGPEGSITRIQDIEAVGAAGSRLAHIIARDDATDPLAWERVGTGTKGSGSWKTAWMLLDAAGLLEQVEVVQIRNPAQAGERLAEGELDALVGMVEEGHAGIAKLLEDPRFTLVDMTRLAGANLALRYPFLRPARIPAGSYPTVEETLNTVSSQAVLATRIPKREDDALRESGPAFVPGVFTRLPQRLPFDTALRLSLALDTPETVDPLLPASPGLTPDTPPTKQRFTADVFSALLNGVALAFLVVMVLLYLRPLPANPELRGGEQPADD